MTTGEGSPDAGQVDEIAAPLLRIMVVDDHDLFRSGLRRLLDGESGFQVVADPRRGDEAVRRAAELRPDVVLMDLNMPGMSGIEATRAIRRAAPETAVVVLTVSTKDDDVVGAVLAGACGYLLKGATLPEIIRAVRGAASGESPIAPGVAGSVLARLSRQHADEVESPDDPGLSGRELAVLTLIVDGRENSEIARQLHLSASTVKHHIAAILDKLGVDNRVQAAVAAVRLRLVET